MDPVLKKLKHIQAFPHCFSKMHFNTTSFQHIQIYHFKVTSLFNTSTAKALWHHSWWQKYFQLSFSTHQITKNIHKWRFEDSSFSKQYYQGCSFRPSNICVDNSASLHPCNFTFNPFHPSNSQTHSYCLQMCLGGGRYGKQMLPSFAPINKWQEKTVKQQRYNPPK